MCGEQCDSRFSGIVERRWGMRSLAASFKLLAKDIIIVFNGRRERGKVAKVEVGEEEKAPRWANEGTDASPLSSTMNPARCSTPTQLGLIFGFCA